MKKSLSRSDLKTLENSKLNQAGGGQKQPDVFPDGIPLDGILERGRRPVGNVFPYGLPRPVDDVFPYGLRGPVDDVFPYGLRITRHK
ncbi:MAG: hypothetical protein MJE77_44730 [Proteobacteria bacterium]|nr:hypothetical protein [Pseudomonadota bacterium]